jgi:uncharacterized SAM-binding protein YcdF (DUF218 family)
MKMRLFHKFVIAFAVIGLAALALLSPLIEGKLRADLLKRTEAEMIAEAQLITLLPAAAIAGQVRLLAVHANARVTLIDSTGRVVADSAGEPAGWDNHLNRSESGSAGP